MIAKGLGDILTFEDLRPYIHICRLESQLPLLHPLLCHLLKFIEGVLAVFRLVSSCLWLTSHPLQFGAIQVVGSFYLRPLVVNAFLAFLKIIGIIAAIGIYSAVVEL